jgi:tetratricopeptide (TPR) repeat protein
MKLCALLLAGTAALVGVPTSIHASPSRAAENASASAYTQGMALMNAHQYARAQIAFRRAIAHKDHLLLSYVELGKADIYLGDLVGGFKAYQQATKLLPRDPALNYYTGVAALNARAYNWAVVYASRSLKYRPNTYLSYHLRFVAYGRLKNKKKQLSDAQMEVKISPSNPESWDDYGIALGNDGQLLRSISAYGKAIKLNPRNWAYYKNRANIEIYNKQHGRALADYEKAAALAPDPADKKLMLDTAAKLKKQLHH